VSGDQLLEMIERSKDDRATFVGSEIRELIAEIQRARRERNQAEIALSQIEAIALKALQYNER
jgi:hypothetical protein